MARKPGGEGMGGWGCFKLEALYGLIHGVFKKVVQSGNQKSSETKHLLSLKLQQLQRQPPEQLWISPGLQQSVQQCGQPPEQLWKSPDSSRVYCTGQPPQEGGSPWGQTGLSPQAGACPWGQTGPSP